MQEKFYGHGLPIDISTHGWQLDQIFNILHIFMAILFVGWFVFLVYTLFRFRQRAGHKATYAPKYTKFSTYLEVGIALFEVLLLVVFAIPAWNYAKATIPSGKDVFSVRVIGEQFAWNMHYPGEDGMYGKTSPQLISAENPIGLDETDAAAKDDIVTINALNIPVNRPIVVHLSSKDVIHSFALPVLRVKQDAVPGMTFPVWFEAKQTGSFDIACAQLCGLGHYRMRGTITVQNEAELAAWMKEQREMMMMEDDY